MTAFIITAIVLFTITILVNALTVQVDTGYKVFGILVNIGLIIWAVTLL